MRTAAENEADSAARKLQPKQDATGLLVLPERLPSGVESSSSDVDSTALDSAATPAKGNYSRAPKFQAPR